MTTRTFFDKKGLTLQSRSLEGRMPTRPVCTFYSCESKSWMDCQLANHYRSECNPLVYIYTCNLHTNRISRIPLLTILLFDQHRTLEMLKGFTMNKSTRPPLQKRLHQIILKPSDIDASIMYKRSGAPQSNIGRLVEVYIL